MCESTYCCQKYLKFPTISSALCKIFIGMSRKLPLLLLKRLPVASFQLPVLARAQQVTDNGQLATGNFRKSIQNQS